MRFFKAKTTQANRVGDLNCSFCGKHQNQVTKLIAGPSVLICNECLDICNEILSHDSQVKSPWPGLTEPPPPSKKSYALQCSFCSKPQKHVQRLIAGPGVYVCNECLEICNEILRDDAMMEQMDLPPHGLTHQAMALTILCPLCQRRVSDFTFIPDRGPLCAQCLEAIKAVLDGSEHKA